MITTEKLYYKDAYIKEFCASVLSSTALADSKFDVVLDKTAFFPEEGGQSADTGYIGQTRVVDVYEKEGIIHHITDSDPGNGQFLCKIDFDLRFEKMQQHTAEHIICGIIHSLYGFENVGFHLSEEEVVFDISSPLEKEDIFLVETLANEAVFSDIEIETFFPDEEELSRLDYRSKLDISENVRIVKIGDVDTCACCAPHVNRTGEIGLIKILNFEKHRGGVRIYMSAGVRALRDYRKKEENIKRISALLSIPQHQTSDALEKYITETDRLRQELKTVKIKAAESLAASYERTEKNAVCFFENYSYDELRAFSNAYKASVGGILVALSGSEMDYRYVISSENVDIGEKIKEINKSLNGRGGGRGQMAQGSFLETLDNIKDYFG